MRKMNWKLTLTCALGAIVLVGAARPLRSGIREAGNPDAARLQHIKEMSATIYKRFSLTLPSSVSETTFACDLRSGRRINCTQIELATSNPDRLLILDWDSDRGELVSVWDSLEDRSPLRYPVLGKVHAAHISRFWLQLLGIASLAPKWRLVEEPQHVDTNAYEAFWDSPGYTVSLVMDDRSGALLRANINRREIFLSAGTLGDPSPRPHHP